MKYYSILLSLLLSYGATCQTLVPFDSPDWVVDGKITHETFQGKAGIGLTDGLITLKDSTFKNGVIEFDMVLAKERYFPGIGFRIQNKANFEYVYLRPHQLGNPDAIQYIPIFNGQDSWQLYYGDGYSTAITYPLNEWVHIKLAIRDAQAEVYVGNVTAPSLVIHQLKRDPKPGKISLISGDPVMARFANFQYTKTDSPALAGAFKAEADPLPGTLLNWQVSGTFSEKQLQTDYTIPTALVNQLTWHNMTAEKSGKLNLSRDSKRSEGNNTVFARLTMLSDKAQVKKLQLGFSDRARVYVNGRVIYAGHDEFQSRDYRFLGTVGYFDELYLDLKKGKNELWIAVSENFGGWGIQGLIDDQSGLTITP